MIQQDAEKEARKNSLACRRSTKQRYPGRYASHQFPPVDSLGWSRCSQDLSANRTQTGSACACLRILPGLAWPWLATAIVVLYSDPDGDDTPIDARSAVRTMSWAYAAASTPPRRRRDFGDGMPDVQRTPSNVSSNASSDILVAGPTQSTTPHQHHDGASSAASHSYNHFPPAAMETSINNGLLAIRFSSGVARDRFRGIIRTKPKPISQASNTTHQHTYKPAIDDDEDSNYGPNHRGTYSKEYTQLHPHIKWVHRGQGRYLPAAEIKSDNPNVSPRPTRYVLPTKIHFCP